MKLIEYNTLFFWHPSFVCNFSCDYCGQHLSSVSNPKEIDINKVISRFDKLNKTLLVSICGGEPFLIPNFTEFVLELTKKHYVRLDTNLSLTGACREFLSKINPERVQEIVFSIHILEREKRKIDLTESVALAKEFQNKGFKIVGNYVVYPPLLQRLDKDMEFFRSQGIKVLPNLFCGSYNGKPYSVSANDPGYSQKDLEVIFRYNPYAKIRLCSPRNELCQAGCTAFCMNDKWEVFPCYTMMKRSENKLGTFFGKWRAFPKVIKCPLDYCGDQYNKTFSTSLDRLNLAHMTLKAAEKGVCSSLESSILLRDYWKKRIISKIRNAMHPFVSEIRSKKR